MLIVRSRLGSMRRIRSGWRSLLRSCLSVVIGKCAYIRGMMFGWALLHKLRRVFFLKIFSTSNYGLEFGLRMAFIRVYEEL
jgi:hypothetical protein